MFHSLSSLITVCFVLFLSLNSNIASTSPIHPRGRQNAQTSYDFIIIGGNLQRLPHELPRMMWVLVSDAAVIQAEQPAWLWLRV